MKVLIDTYTNTGTLHHGYAIVGERQRVRESLENFFDTALKIERQGNPDYFLSEYDTFTIDHSRELGERQMKKSFGPGRKIFVISFQFITREAQNALLKIFEEPTAGTHFFLIAPTADIFLPTLRSRLYVVAHSRNQKPDALAQKFLSLSLPERLEFLKEIIEEKDKEKALSILDGLELILEKELKDGSVQGRLLKPIHDLLTLKSYLYDRGSSVKLIMEHLALTLPVLHRSSTLSTST